ncbi:MAG: DNA gyrase inhibitor YacG [Candidatus Anammoxibacter sp.]
MPKIKCPYCNKEIVYKTISDISTFPFCSRKCKLIDLGLWFDEEHRIGSDLNSQVDNTEF